MIDLDALRSEPEIFRSNLKKRFMPVGLVDDLLAEDKIWREVTTRIDALRSERNGLSRDADTAKTNAVRLKEIKTELAELETTEKESAMKRDQLLPRIPNLLSEDVPVGEGESANKVVKTVGKIGLTEGLPHEDLMTKLDWLDLESAAEVSGARFRYLKKDAALAWMKLSRLAFEFAAGHGFVPVIPPIIVRGETLLKGGFFPEGEPDTFKVGEDMYLVGTSEYSLVAMAMDKVYNEADLPLRLVGFSSCFRQEAGSYGRDVRGMIRQHQFDKVEMVSICTPEKSEQEHQFLLSMQENFIKQFNLPYQVILIGSGDTEKKAIKRFDIETWFPGQKKYRETHSVSNCTDYQARALSIKYRDQNGQSQFAHTLNGTVTAERLLLAIIENNQTADGRVELPTELKS